MAAHTGQDTNRRSRSSDVEQSSCPLCHQTLPADFSRSGVRTGQSATSVDDTSTPHNAFVHPEYFGLLASCLEEEHALDMEDDDHLRSDSFNQGYCARFFVEEGVLGRGGKAEVIKVRHVLEGVSLGVFALKRVAVGDSQSWLIKTLQEVQSLRFKHPNLISYNHVWLERRQRSFSPTIPVLHILQEYCDGGDLESFVYRQCGKIEPSFEQLKERTRRRSRGQSTPPVTPGLSADMIYSFFRDILAGLAFLHDQGMIHRDMKSSNCLLDMNGPTTTGVPRVMVSDFGEAQFAASREQRSGSTGTLAYTAPEIIRGEQWTTAADIFSLGMILYFLTHEGSLPYKSSVDDFDGLRHEILSFKGYSLFSTHSRMSEEDQRELGTVLSSLLAPNPVDRPSCTELLALMQLHEHNTSQPSLTRPVARRFTHTQNADAMPKWPITRVSASLPIEDRRSKLLLESDTAMMAESVHCLSFANIRSQVMCLATTIAKKQDELLSLALLLIRFNLLETLLSTDSSRSQVLMAILFVNLGEVLIRLSHFTRLLNTLLMALFVWAVQL